MSPGMAITTTHAPEVNLVVRKMTVATAVMTTPIPFSDARAHHRLGLARAQWRTRPQAGGPGPDRRPSVAVRRRGRQARPGAGGVTPQVESGKQRQDAEGDGQSVERQNRE